MLDWISFLSFSLSLARLPIKRFEIRFSFNVYWITSGLFFSPFFSVFASVCSFVSYGIHVNLHHVCQKKRHKSMKDGNLFRYSPWINSTFYDLLPGKQTTLLLLTHLICLLLSSALRCKIGALLPTNKRNVKLKMKREKSEKVFVILFCWLWHWDKTRKSICKHTIIFVAHNMGSRLTSNKQLNEKSLSHFYSQTFSFRHSKYDLSLFICVSSR